MRSPRAVIVGSGVAGLTTALALGDCVVVTKSELGSGSSGMAQGGIAAAVGAGDDPAAHAADTVAVGGGLTDPVVAGLVTAAAPERIAWLVALGADLDRNAGGRLTLGREAGHRAHRIVHANGDATGAELMRALCHAVSLRPDIEVRTHTAVLDVVRAGGVAAGALLLGPEGEQEVVVAPAVVLATGGIGRLYAASTNPAQVSGDGMAIAVRAGARIVDPEFVQFHPTALRSPLDPLPLLTEALRGEGAVLVDADGERFMVAEHPDAELAPRDVVARAIWRRIETGADPRLDATHLGATFPERFPTVFAAARRAGIDPRRQPLPVTPAAHYHMGGVAADPDGRTTVPGLFAVGEAASTGLHGANRLASNSLLEGLVLGGRVAAAVATAGTALSGELRVPAAELGDDDPGAVAALRRLMWDEVGVMRHDAGLRRALGAVAELAPRLRGPVGRNLSLVAEVVTRAALDRTESRGGHHRLDHPHPVAAWERHTVVDPAPAPAVPLRLLAGVA